MKNQQTYNRISQVLYSTLETQKSSFDLAKHVVDNDIEGDIIECGIAAGGNFATMILGATENEKGAARRFWGFDSFEGIQRAGKKDAEQAGIGAITHDTNVPYEDLLVTTNITAHSLQQVMTNLMNWGLDKYDVNLIQGWVQNSIPTVIDQINKIAILRLDMDVYHPTIFTLEALWDKISVGGIVIIDDWALSGVRVACEEFFEAKGINPEIHTVENSTPTYFFKG
jgi:O-methyltransferase